MPSIDSRVVPLDTTKYEPVSMPSPQASLPMPETNVIPGQTPNLRCALPPIYAAADNLRQIYNGGQTPLYRVFPLAPLKA